VKEIPIIYRCECLLVLRICACKKPSRREWKKAEPWEMQPQRKKAIPLKMVRPWHTDRTIFRKLLCQSSFIKPSVFRTRLFQWVVLNHASFVLLKFFHNSVAWSIFVVFLQYCTVFYDVREVLGLSA